MLDNDVYLPSTSRPLVLPLTSTFLVQALQKLIYVSALVFGERKAAFLLPWRRIAEVNDATIARAITDNGKMRMVAELGRRTTEMQVCLLRSVSSQRTIGSAAASPRSCFTNENILSMCHPGLCPGQQQAVCLPFINTEQNWKKSHWYPA